MSIWWLTRNSWGSKSSCSRMKTRESLYRISSSNIKSRAVRSGTHNRRMMKKKRLKFQNTIRRGNIQKKRRRCVKSYWWITIRCMLSWSIIRRKRTSRISSNNTKYIPKKLRCLVLTRMIWAVNSCTRPSKLNRTLPLKTIKIRAIPNLHPRMNRTWINGLQGLAGTK